MWYTGFISLKCCGVKPYPVLQIFPICEGDPLSPPEGEAAEVVHPRDPRVKLPCPDTIPARRGPDGAAWQTPTGGFSLVLNFFMK